MVSYYSSVTPVIRNHPIYMQYSTHKELKTDNSPNQVVSVFNLTHFQQFWFKKMTIAYNLSLIYDHILLLRNSSLCLSACPGSSAGGQCSAWRWDGKHGHSSRCVQHGRSWIPKPCTQGHCGKPLLSRHPGCSAPGTDRFWYLFFCTYHGPASAFLIIKGHCVIIGWHQAARLQIATYTNVFQCVNMSVQHSELKEDVLYMETSINGNKNSTTCLLVIVHKREPTSYFLLLLIDPPECTDWPFSFKKRFVIWIHQSDFIKVEHCSFKGLHLKVN